MSTEQQVVYGVPEASTDASAPLQFTAERLRVWGVKSALALVDQGLFSGAGFLVNLLLARWLAPASYGAFAVAFAGFLFISAFYTVLLPEPLTIFGSGSHSGCLPAYFRVQLAIHFVLVGWLAIAGLIGGVALWRATPDSPLVGAIFGSALMLPLLLLLWLVRRMCYVLQRPGLAVAGTATYLALIIGGLAVMAYYRWATPLLSFFLMGVASLAASGVVLARIGFFHGAQASGRISWRAALGENWTYGRWLLGSAMLSSISNQTQTFFVAGFLGLGSAGILRAVQIPMLIMMQVIAATALLVLPGLSNDFTCGHIERLRKKSVQISIGLAGMTLAFAGVLALAPSRVEHVLFGGKYAAYASLIPVTALVPACIASSVGYGMALRASLKPHFDLVVNAITTPIGIVSAYFFIRRWSLVGAVISMVLTFAVYSFATWCLYRFRFSALREAEPAKCGVN